MKYTVVHVIGAVHSYCNAVLWQYRLAAVEAREAKEKTESVKPVDIPLKPCPFCGCKTPRISEDMDDHVFSVICQSIEDSCLAEGLWHDTREQAAEFWNRRPLEDALGEQVRKEKEVRLALESDARCNDAHIKFLNDHVDTLNAKLRESTGKPPGGLVPPTAELIGWMHRTEKAERARHEAHVQLRVSENMCSILESKLAAAEAREARRKAECAEKTCEYPQVFETPSEEQR